MRLRIMRAVKVFVCIFLYLAGFANLVIPEESFIYNSHGKRDPFIPLVGIKKVKPGLGGIQDVISIGDVKFEGVAYDSRGNKLAIMNGEMIRVGQTIGRVTLKAVKDDIVIFSIDNEEYSLSLYEDRRGGFISGR